jgi:hypothetical protein
MPRQQRRTKEECITHFILKNVRSSKFLPRYEYQNDMDLVN